MSCLCGVIHVVISPCLLVQPLLPAGRKPRPLGQLPVVLCHTPLLCLLLLCLLELEVALPLGHHAAHLELILLLHLLKLVADGHLVSLPLLLQLYLALPQLLSG